MLDNRAAARCVTKPPSPRSPNYNLHEAAYQLVSSKSLHVRWARGHLDSRKAHSLHDYHDRNGNELADCAARTGSTMCPSHGPSSTSPADILMNSHVMLSLVRKWIIKSRPQKLVPEAHWTSWLPLRAVNTDKWGPWLWGTLRWPGYGAPWETDPARCIRCGQRHGQAVQECCREHGNCKRVHIRSSSVDADSRHVNASGFHGSHASVQISQNRGSHGHAKRQSFLLVQAHWRVVIATWHFHVFQRLQAWTFDKLKHAPTYVSNKWPTHVVPPVKGAPPQAAKPTARNLWNHVRGVFSLPPSAQTKFVDTAPTMGELGWQLTQAVTTAEHQWVLDAMTRHQRSVLHGIERPRKSSPPLEPASRPPARDVSAAPAGVALFLAQAERELYQAQSGAVQLSMVAVASALTSHGIAWKTLLLARHSEHLKRQMYFFHKVQAIRWYVEAQYAVCSKSWLADLHRLRLRMWRTSVYPMTQATQTHKLALASRYRGQTHSLGIESILREEESA